MASDVVFPEFVGSLSKDTMKAPVKDVVNGKVKATVNDMVNGTASHTTNGPIKNNLEGVDVRLRHLIQQSSIYVSILQEKMQKQQEEQRKIDEKTMLKNATEIEATSTPTSTPATENNRRRSGRAVNSTAKTPDTPPVSKTAKKRGSARRPGRPRTIKDFFNTDDLPSNVGSTSQALAESAIDDSKLGEHKNLRSARQPKLITGGVMKDYQLEGLEWLISLYENGLNGILADEMGLGKTLQTISFLAFLREKRVYGPFLIVGPVSVISSWVDEIARWAPEMPKVLYHGTPQERADIRQNDMSKVGPGFPVVCTSYEIVMNDKKFLTKYRWKFIIVDEGHRLKNMNCKLIRELKTYDSTNRLLLTGTPLQNNLSELWSLLNFLLPEVFDDYAYFEDYFDFSKLEEKDKESHVAFLEEQKQKNLVGSLHALLKPFLLRRVKTDVETNLPPKKEYVLYAPLSQAQKDLYGALLDHRGHEWLHDQVIDKHGPSNKRKFLEIRDSYGSTPKKSKTRREGNTQSYRELSDD
jgi:ATP-dependent DNA helicase